MTGWLKLVALFVVAAVAASVYFAWRGQQKATAELQTQLKAAQQSLAEATARQDTRDAQMAQLLSQLDKQKAAVQRPDQVVKALPDVLPLPKPIEVVTVPAVDGGSKAAAGGKPSAPVQQVSLPIEDLKPLYDFASDCKACQVKLAAALGDLKDEKAKTATVSRERDAALKVAHGGSTWHRVAVAAKWFALGAAAGAVTVKLKR